MYQLSIGQYRRTVETRQSLPTTLSAYGSVIEQTQVHPLVLVRAHAHAPKSRLQTDDSGTKYDYASATMFNIYCMIYH